MKRFFLFLGLLLSALCTGCATSQDVKLARASSKPIASYALRPSEGNSADMNQAIKEAFVARGVAPRANVPPGTNRSSDSDLIVDYNDQWRWDMVMYLRWVSVSIYDAESGEMLATARWDNSAFHGFQNAHAVVKGLVDDMLNKIKPKS